MLHTSMRFRNVGPHRCPFILRDSIIQNFLIKLQDIIHIELLGEVGEDHGLSNEAAQEDNEISTHQQDNKVKIFCRFFSLTFSSFSGLAVSDGNVKNGIRPAFQSLKTVRPAATRSGIPPFKSLPVRRATRDRNSSSSFGSKQEMWYFCISNSAGIKSHQYTEGRKTGRQQQ